MEKKLNLEEFELRNRTHYAFRAECTHDIIEFQKQLLNTDYNVLNWDFSYKQSSIFPDVECEITINLEIDDLKKLMMLIPDGHILYQTLKPINEYDGVRNYDLIPFND